MANHIIPEVVDLTDGDSPQAAEVLTPAGVIRVTTGQVHGPGSRPAVVVEVDPNKHGNAKTHPGGNWNAATSRRRGRTYVFLTQSTGGEAVAAAEEENGVDR